MISRKGTRRSGAASGLAKILREEGSGPVVTAGKVVSGLERMFMRSSLITRCAHGRWLSSLRGAKRRSNPGSSRGSGVLRGACHLGALRADPLARNDGVGGLRWPSRRLLLHAEPGAHARIGIGV